MNGPERRATVVVGMVLLGLILAVPTAFLAPEILTVIGYVLMGLGLAAVVGLCVFVLLWVLWNVLVDWFS